MDSYNNANWNTSSNWSSAPAAPSSAGFGQSRSWNNRRINLRTHNWGNRSNNGWSGFNNAKYQPQNLSSWEHKSIILEELRAQRGLNRGVSFASSPSYISSGSTYSTLSSAPLTSALPISSLAAPSAPATIVPVNMLPPPINDGTKYEKIIGNKRGTRRYRKHLKQPLSNYGASPLNNAALPLQQPRNMTPLGAGLHANGYGQPALAPTGGKLSRKQRRAIKKNGVHEPSSHLTPLGTSATSGLNGLPSGGFNNGLGLNNGLNSGLNNNFAPLSGQKLSRKQKKALKKQNKLPGALSGPSVLPANLPVNNAIPVTNVIGSPILSTTAPLSNGLSDLSLGAAPLSTFTKTEQITTTAPYAIGRSAF